MNTLSTSTSAPRAFTLIEVLLAVTVFALVLAAIHAVFFGALRLRNKTTEQIDQSLNLLHTLEIIQRDFANIVPPGGTLAGTFQTDVASSTMTATAQNLQFQTAVGRLNDLDAWGEVQRVSYGLSAPTNGASGLDLYRHVTRNLLPVLTDEVESQWLMSGVQTLGFAFYDGTQWKQTWDSTNEVTPLPLAVKVQLQLATDDPAALLAQRAPVELVVPLVVQVATNEVAGGTGGGA